MELHRFLVLAFFLFASLVLAGPTRNAAQCSTVTKVISRLHATSQASRFCSSYLHLKTSTATVTNTNTKTTSLTGTVTRTVTVTSTGTITSVNTAGTTTVVDVTATASSTTTTTSIETTTKTVTQVSTTTTTQTATITPAEDIVTITNQVTQAPRTLIITENPTVTDTATEIEHTSSTITVSNTKTISPTCISGTVKTNILPVPTLSALPGKRAQITAPSQPVTTPSCFRGWGPSSVSAACSCLALKQATKTITKTASTTKTLGAIATTEVTTVVPKTAIAMITFTTTSTSTVTTTTTSVKTETEQVTETATTTETQITTQTDDATTTLLAATSTATSDELITPTTTITTTITSTTTTTETQTVTDDPATETAVATVVSQPVLNGLRWYRYNFAPGDSRDPSLYQNNPNYARNGVLQDINVRTSTSGNYECTLPGAPTEACTRMAVVMQGFLYAQTTGRYTFSVSYNIDDFLYAYSGPIAGGRGAMWRSDNTDIYSSYSGGGKTFNYDLQAGDLVPITFIYMNDPLKGILEFSLKSPDGSSSTTRDHFVQPCEGSSNMVP